jgi:glycerol-3-phosphate dehydrogenase
MPLSILEKRNKRLQDAQNRHFDVAIIGGGINGAAIARELSLRGYDVILLEKNDLASGTSSASSKLAHGGIRYLEQGHISLVKESCKERRRLLDNAPHLVKPLPFILPIYKTSPFSRLKIRIGLWIYDYISFNSNIKPHKMLSKAETLALEPTLKEEGLLGAGLYYDAQMDDARLCIETALQAQDFGATILPYCEVKKIHTNNKIVTHIDIHDTVLDTSFKINATLFINTSGPWTDSILEKIDPRAGKKLRPSKGIHIVTKPITSQHAVVLRTESDNRVFFIMPWKGHSLIGTTDTDFNENADTVKVTQEDINYLLSETNRRFPKAGLSKEDIYSSFAGIRPLLKKRSGNIGSVSREEKIIKTNNLFSLIGGKYTTYRVMAEKLAKEVTKELGGKKFKSLTKSLPLFGGEIKNIPHYIDTYYLAEKDFYSVEKEIYAAIVTRYGSAYSTVLHTLKEHPSYTELLTGTNVYKGEVIYSIRYELALKPNDFLRRRTTLALEKGYSEACKKEVDELFKKELSN